MRTQAITFASFLASIVAALAPTTAKAETNEKPSAADHAEPVPAESDSNRPIYAKGGLVGLGLVVAGKVGGGLSLSKLGGSPVGELELGYDLPVLDRALQVFLSGQYLAPTVKGSGIVDPRLPEPASYKVVQQEGVLTLGGLYRITVPTDILRPYVGVGARLYLLRTVVRGSAGQAFGENSETDTRIGAWGAIGSEFYLGPGAILVEVSAAYSGLNGFVMRDSSTGGISGALGYRFFI